MFFFLFLSFTQTIYANDSVTVKTISMELARDIANESINACRKKGYQVSAVVVDRSGIIQVALRDDLASRFTLQIAQEKANSVILSGINSGEFRRSRDDIRPELNHMDDIIIMQGALPIEIAGSKIGAIGVSGAPGGDRDEYCAQQALDKFSERLEFAE
ncbi:MAG TPA: heme-binding protein [Gammaproteobacteria bacterium]|nr:heme-binding protein [Gammaproteobacteria bacterium]